MPNKRLHVVYLNWLSSVILDYSPNQYSSAFQFLNYELYFDIKKLINFLGQFNLVKKLITSFHLLLMPLMTHFGYYIGLFHEILFPVYFLGPGIFLSGTLSH